MENKIVNIFSRRLKQARLMRGMSLEALSKSIDNAVTRQSLHKYEQGKMLPDSRLLLALAASLDVKADFFFRPFAVEVDELNFRKKIEFSESKVNSLKVRIQEEVERYLEIEQICGNANFMNVVKKMVQDENDAINLASELRGKFQLGNDGISNVVEVLEDNGIIVIEIEESESFNGLSGIVNGKIPIIVVNSKLDAEHKRFTILHEFGHIIMQFPEEIDQKEKESLCNVFAYEMLIPRSVLINKIGNKRQDISLSELIDIQIRFGISVDSLIRLLHQYGVISEKRYRSFKLKMNSDNNFKEVIRKSRIPEEKSRRFLRLVYRALADELISLSKAATLLNMTADRVQAHLQLI